MHHAVESQAKKLLVAPKRQLAEEVQSEELSHTPKREIAEKFAMWWLRSTVDLAPKNSAWRHGMSQAWAREDARPIVSNYVALLEKYVRYKSDEIVVIPNKVSTNPNGNIEVLTVLTVKFGKVGYVSTPLKLVIGKDAEGYRVDQMVFHRKKTIIVVHPSP